MNIHTWLFKSKPQRVMLFAFLPIQNVHIVKKLFIYLNFLNKTMSETYFLATSFYVFISFDHFFGCVCSTVFVSWLYPMSNNCVQLARKIESPALWNFFMSSFCKVGTSFNLMEKLFYDSVSLFIIYFRASI